VVFIISILATVYLAWSATALFMIVNSSPYSPNIFHVLYDFNRTLTTV